MLHRDAPKVVQAIGCSTTNDSDDDSWDMIRPWIVGLDDVCARVASRCDVPRSSPPDGRVSTMT